MRETKKQKERRAKHETHNIYKDKTRRLHTPVAAAAAAAAASAAAAAVASYCLHRRMLVLRRGLQW